MLMLRQSKQILKILDKEKGTSTYMNYQNRAFDGWNFINILQMEERE